MPFGNITAQTKVYEPRSPGIYSLAGLSFEQPGDEFRLKGATRGDIRTCSVTRVIQKDVTLGAELKRLGLVVSLQIQIPSVPSFTSAMADSAATDISEFITSGNVSRLLQGEI